MSEPVLSIRGLERSYVTGAGPLTVLRGADLDVMPGEIVGLIGPSGSGKSSLLHAAGLLEHPNAGRITILGRDCSDLPDRDRTRVRLATIGFVYQFHHLLPEFSALDNVAMPLLIRRMKPAAAHARALEMLDAVGLKARAAHRPGELSGGERQRVAIARALVTRPACVLADEPTGNLDRDTANGVFEHMLALARDRGTAFVVVTHDSRIAARCQRQLRLERGVLVPPRVAEEIAL